MEAPYAFLFKECDYYRNYYRTWSCMQYILHYSSKCDFSNEKTLGKYRKVIHLIFLLLCAENVHFKRVKIALF